MLESSVCLLSALSLGWSEFPPSGRMLAETRPRQVLCVQDKKYRQAITAAGSGALLEQHSCMATMCLHHWLACVSYASGVQGITLGCTALCRDGSAQYGWPLLRWLRMPCTVADLIVHWRGAGAGCMAALEVEHFLAELGEA